MNDIRIFALKFLDEGWTLLNHSVMVRLTDGNIEAKFDKRLIEEETAAAVIDQYMKETLEKMERY